MKWKTAMYGKIFYYMIKSKSKDKNTTHMIAEPVGSPAAPVKV